jgi:hypothetical protein
MSYQNGTTYWGEWRDGTAEGRGEIQYPQNNTDGKIYYDGEIRNGVPSGQGWLEFANMTTYEGQFKDGYMHGWGRMNDNGTMMEGDW